MCNAGTFSKGAIACDRGGGKCLPALMTHTSIFNLCAHFKYGQYFIVVHILIDLKLSYLSNFQISCTICVYNTCNFYSYFLVSFSCDVCLLYKSAMPGISLLDF